MGWAFVWRLLGATIPIPVLIFPAAWAWWKLDRHSYVRQAVTEMVAGAELEASRAELKAAHKIKAALQQKVVVLETANSRFANNVQTSLTELEQANAQISELLSRPVNNSCAVDRQLLDRLRNR